MANGVRKALIRIFLAHPHRDPKEEFVSFVARLDEYSNISKMDEEHH